MVLYRMTAYAGKMCALLYIVHTCMHVRLMSANWKCWQYCYPPTIQALRDFIHSLLSLSSQVTEGQPPPVRPQSLANYSCRQCSHHQGGDRQDLRHRTNSVQEPAVPPLAPANA